MNPSDDLKEDRDSRIEDKGSYLLTLEMFKNFPEFKELNDLYYNPEEDEEC